MALGPLPRLALACAVVLSAFAAGVNAGQSARPAASPTEVEAGKKLFVQRCSVCHLPPLGPGQPRPVAKLLTGVVKSPETENAARLIIQKGIPQRMPGFQLGLESKEIDSIVAYLSRLK